MCFQIFTAGGKTRRKRTTFTVLAGQSVRAGAESTWDSLLLKVPAVSPTIANCDFIRVEYSVRVSLVVPGGCDLSVSLPIVVGTVPHRPNAAIGASSSSARIPRPVAAPSHSHRCSHGRTSGGGSSNPAPPYTERPQQQQQQQQQQQNRRRRSAAAQPNSSNSSSLPPEPPSYRECMDAEAAVDLVEEGDFSETSSLYGDTRYGFRTLFAAVKIYQVAILKGHF